MRNIQLQSITKSYHGELILDNLNLTIPGGKFFALLGPSGSGKTTILRLIGGFEVPDKGNIYLGNENITQIPINERRVNTVFQQYALFPHMNVFENVAYSLRLRRVPSEMVEQKVIRVLQKVHLEKQIYKSVLQLSGGQQQRVALARAIINEPAVLLLDEPLAALDLKLRERMLVELIDLQVELKTTFVYVTHDQLEALTVADTMAILNENGHIEQIGTPKDIYEFPISSFVARFVGTTNIFEGIVHFEHDHYSLQIDNLGEFPILISENKAWIYDGSKVLMSLRPEKIEIRKSTKEGFSNQWEGVVVAIIYHGRSTQYNVRLKNNALVHVFEQNEEHVEREPIDYDDSVYLYWQKENAVLLEK